MDSSVVANAMRRHDKRVLFASKWCFKPEGVARVKEELGAMFHMGQQITNFDWDEKNAVSYYFPFHIIASLRYRFLIHRDFLWHLLYLPYSVV
jgi:hypothetical protein